MPRVMAGLASLFFFYIFTVALPSAGSEKKPAVTVKEIIKNIRDSINRIKPFRVDFIQQVFSDDGSQPDLEESGEILFKNERLLKWTYKAPDYKVFLLEGDEYRFYDEDNEQLIIGKVIEKQQQWLWQLLFSDDVFPYAGIAGIDPDAGSVKGTFKKILIKNDNEGVDVEITIDAGYLPVKVVRIDGAGIRLVYFLKEYKGRIKIAPGSFRLSIPENVEVVEQ